MNDYNRELTRKERYAIKAKNAKSYPISIATIHFRDEGNVAFVARSAACFGAREVCVIGRMPEDNELKRLSGGHSGLVPITCHPNAVSLIEYCRNNGIFLISLELTDEAVDLDEADIPLDIPLMVVIGHEQYGVPVEILHRSDMIIKISMDGPGWALNASQSANIALYEITKRYKNEHSRR